MIPSLLSACTRLFLFFSSSGQYPSSSPATRSMIRATSCRWSPMICLLCHSIHFSRIFCLSSPAICISCRKLFPSSSKLSAYPISFCLHSSEICAHCSLSSRSCSFFPMIMASSPFCFHDYRAVFLFLLSNRGRERLHFLRQKKQVHC